jgi:hypothetical protein
VLAVLAALALAGAGCTAARNQDNPVSGAGSGNGSGANGAGSSESLPPPAPGQVSVYPTPGSRTASPQTQISIRGTAPNRIGTISVVGSQSGTHTGTLRPDSDRRGASYYLTKPLDPGEQVTVSTSLNIVGASTGRYRFTVSRPITQHAKPGDEAGGNTAEQHFRSAPWLEPPTISIDQPAPTDTAGDIFLAPKDGPGQDGPMIIRPDGQLVWFDPLPNRQRAYDFTEQRYLGRPVLTWYQGYNTTDGHGQGFDVIFDNSYHRIATVYAGNGYHADLHDFVITRQNTALVTAYQPVHWDMSSVGWPSNGIVLDSILQEIDIPTGNVLDEWHSLDHIPLTDTFATPGNKPYFDYFHINSVDENGADNLLVSARATHAIYDIDPRTGDVVWQLGGKHSTFSGTGTSFSSQHDAQWLGPHTVSVFDNASGVGHHTQPRSRGLIIALNMAGHTATITKSFSTTSVGLASSQGNLQPLPGGGAFVGWGAEPQFTEFAPDGSVVFQGSLPSHDQSYRAYLLPWSGQPATHPAVVAQVSDGVTDVAVSWNGATEVRSWRVLAGATPTTLSPVSTESMDGFETTIRLSGAPSYVQVEALDASGTMIGTSTTVAAAG